MIGRAKISHVRRVTKLKSPRKQAYRHNFGTQLCIIPRQGHPGSFSSNDPDILCRIITPLVKKKFVIHPISPIVPNMKTGLWQAFHSFGLLWFWSISLSLSLLETCVVTTSRLICLDLQHYQSLIYHAEQSIIRSHERLHAVNNLLLGCMTLSAWFISWWRTRGNT